MNNMIGQHFHNIKLKRANRVLPLLTVTSSVKVHDIKVAIDPLLLFQRISVTKQFEDHLQQFLQYELVPYLLALFDDIRMRKTKKSSLFDCFIPVYEVCPKSIRPTSIFRRLAYSLSSGWWHPSK